MERYSTEILLKSYNSNMILLDGNRLGAGRDSGGDTAGGDGWTPPAGGDLDDEVPF